MLDIEGGTDENVGSRNTSLQNVCQIEITNHKRNKNIIREEPRIADMKTLANNEVQELPWSILLLQASVLQNSFTVDILFT
jgi:hypothetical protein